MKLEALRAVDPERVAKRIADKEGDIARQEAVVEWLRDQLDGEERHLWSMENALADLRHIAAQLTTHPAVPADDGHHDTAGTAADTDPRSE